MAVKIIDDEARASQLEFMARKLVDDILPGGRYSSDDRHGRGFMIGQLEMATIFLDAAARLRGLPNERAMSVGSGDPMPIDMGKHLLPWSIIQTEGGATITDDDGKPVLAVTASQMDPATVRLLFSAPHGVALAQAVLRWDKYGGDEQAYSDMVMSARDVLRLLAPDGP